MNTVVNQRSVTLMAIAFISIVAPSCANGNFGQALQRSLSADPQLAENSAQLGGTAPSALSVECAAEVRAQLPEAFPVELCYPTGELLDVTSQTSASDDREVSDRGEDEPATDGEGTPQGEGQNENATDGEAIATDWQTTDSTNQVQQYYQTLLDENAWEIVEQTSQEPRQMLEAVKAGNRIIIDISSQVEDDQEIENADADTTPTTFTVTFHSRQSDAISGSDNGGTTLTPEAARLFSQIDPDADSSSRETSREQNPDAVDGEPDTARSSTVGVGTVTQFSDIGEAPEELQTYIEDLAQLGILTAAEGNNIFKPNEAITRAEYAQWLMQANNRLYGDRPSRKIRQATESATPVFQDVSPSSDAFDAIQGLAEAGLISSRLSGDTTVVNFRPEAPLTRETLITWKVPLDVRSNLPNATVDAVRQTWGFQDANRIEPKALQAVLADYQNGDNANILRAFGYTTLFQPQKNVTRAEAAAVLWRFGYQGDSISVPDVLSDTSSGEAD